MALYELSTDNIAPLELAKFASLGLLERKDLQRLIRDHIETIAPNTLVISEEFSSWDKSDRRIDLLAVDEQARLVVIELKRTTDDSFADLQALRYASMVSRMTFDDAVETYRSYVEKRSLPVDDPAKALLDFLHWPEPTAGRFGEDVRIVLAAADFSTEVTSTVLWLNDRDLDIRCVRMRPYRLGPKLILDIDQIIPLPEAGDFQVEIRQKQREIRASAEGSDWTRYDVSTDEGLQQKLYKREVMLAAVRQLIKRGKLPSEIEAATGRHMLEEIEGNLDGAAFRVELINRHPNSSKIEKRFFTEDDQLFHPSGNTFALTNQWSKDSMEAALAALKAQFGDFGFSIKKTA